MFTDGPFSTWLYETMPLLLLCAWCVAIVAFPARKFRPAKLNLSPNEIRSVSQSLDHRPSVYMSSIGDLLCARVLYSWRYDVCEKKNSKKILHHRYLIRLIHNDIYNAKYTQKPVQKHVKIRCFGPYPKQEDYICDTNQVHFDVNACYLLSNSSI